jgi:hypothetical protein
MRFGARLACAVVMIAVAPASLLAQTGEEIQRATAEAIRHLDLQLDLPLNPEPPQWHFQLPAEFLWVGIACGAVFLVYQFLANWRGSGSAGSPWSGAGADGAEIGGQPAAPTIATADELAGQGLFGEAMHVLLLQSLVEIRVSLGEKFADSLTSREILRQARLPDTGLSALRNIIARVEWTYFGAYPAARADYERCRDSFAELTRTLRGVTPA